MSILSTISKLEIAVFLALVFSIPFQTRSFLFGPHSPTTEPEKFVEWNSAFLYFTDGLLLALLALAVIRLFVERQNILPAIKPLKIPIVFLSIFVLFAGVSLFNAELPDYAAYRFFKLLAYIFLFLYIATQVDFGFMKKARSIGGRLDFRWVLGAFLASGVFQAAVALLQFANQQSLGLTRLHESPLRLGMREVAHLKTALGPISFMQPLQDYMDMIRAYGTFPSPNVLAGFLGICIFFGLYILFAERIKNEKRQLALFARKHYSPSPKTILGTSAIIIVFQGFILSFSRGASFFLVLAVFSLFAGFFVIGRLKRFRARIVKVFLVVGFSWLVLLSLNFPEVSSRFLTSSASEDSIEERAAYNKAGIEAVSREEGGAFLGVGMGNFVNDYMENSPGLKLYLYQPVHNIYLLIASEIGIIGALAFVLFLASLAFKSAKVILRRHEQSEGGVLFIYTLLASLLFLSLVGLYDHYFWTLQQGALMFWVLLGLLAGAARENNKTIAV